MLNSSGDRASSWQIMHLTVTCAIGLKLAFSVVFPFPTEFLMKAFRALLILNSFRHSRIHVSHRLSLVN